MIVKEDEEVVRFVLLEETGPQDVLLFNCKKCSTDKKLTSYQIETHMRDRHDASKLTVELPEQPRSRSRKSSAS